MANVFAVHSVGNSIVTYLRNTYPTQSQGMDMPACGFELVSGGELAGEIDESTRITLYLYRLTVNEHGRQTRNLHRPSDQPVPVSLDLHFLLTVWADNALDEQVAMAWAVRQLHQSPVLDISSLSPDGGWARDDVVQIIPAELSTEDVMRIWDALNPPYRLSMSYVARVVSLDPEHDDESFAPVVARRYRYGEEADV